MCGRVRRAIMSYLAALIQNSKKACVPFLITLISFLPEPKHLASLLWCVTCIRLPGRYIEVFLRMDPRKTPVLWLNCSDCGFQALVPQGRAHRRGQGKLQRLSSRRHPLALKRAFHRHRPNTHNQLDSRPLAVVVTHIKANGHQTPPCHSLVMTSKASQIRIHTISWQNVILRLSAFFHHLVTCTCVIH